MPFFFSLKKLPPTNNFCYNEIKCMRKPLWRINISILQHDMFRWWFFFSNSWFNAVHVYIRQNAVPLSMDERGNFSTPSPFKLQVDRRPFIIFIPMSWKILGQIKRLSWNHHSSLYCFWQCIIFLFFFLGASSQLKQSVLLNWQAWGYSMSNEVKDTFFSKSSWTERDLNPSSPTA